MADVFLYLVLFAVALWTARLAMSKGRNAWGWGGAALILSFMPWHLLGVVPVLVLLFIKTPSTLPAARPDRPACPRCAKPHADGQHFCTGCGWDLTNAYSPEETGDARPPQPQSQAPRPPAPAAASPKAKEPVTEPETAEAPPAASAERAEEPMAGEQVAEPASAEGEQEPAAAHVPWGTYPPGEAPTAAVMTGRGMERFNAGKLQEAIDQFTKAIALDPNYAEAWQRRAEAYARLGRPEQAAEDRRHLQGLDPSSSPG